MAGLHVAEPRKRLPRTRTGNMIGLTDQVTDYWIERLSTPMPKLRALGLAHEQITKNSLSYSDDALRHYGHWTLAEGIRDAHGRTRLVLVNGDRYSGTGGFGPGTTARTMAAESAARSAGFEVLNVPFSALGAAGIELDSIRVLESLRETWSVTLSGCNEANIERLYDLKRHEDGSLSVRDERAGWQENVRFPIETIERPIVGGGTWTEYRVPRFRHWLGEALFSARVRGRSRRAKFLSAFDHQEAAQCYFLCELPPTRARTVAEAFEALAPAEVKRAQEAGLDVLRQGDIFAIPTSLTTRELKSRAIDQTFTRYEQTGVEIVRQGRRYNSEIHDYELVDLPEPYERPIWAHVPYAVKALRMAPLLKTNHVATEQIQTTDGDLYARGVLRHRPDGREADHAQLRLGDRRTWYRIIKNTVPIATTVRTNTPWLTAQQSGQARAWTLGGAVD